MTVFHYVGRFLLSAPRLLALPIEAWQGAEIHRRLAENVYVNLPKPLKIVETPQPLKQDKTLMQS